MPSEVTKKDVWQIAQTLMEADTIPTVVSVRSRLGGGNPHTIASHLAGWREVHTQEKILFYTEREAMMAVQEEMERERLDLMEEIERLDHALDGARRELATGAHALDVERKAHERAKTQNKAQQQQLEEARENAKKLAEQLDTRLEKLQAALTGGKQAGSAGREEAEKLAQQNQALKIEVATLKERAIHAEAFKTLVEKLQSELASLARRAEPEKTDTKAPAPSAPKSGAGKPETEPAPESTGASTDQATTRETKKEPQDAERKETKPQGTAQGVKPAVAPTQAPSPAQAPKEGQKIQRQNESGKGAPGGKPAGKS